MSRAISLRGRMTSRFAIEPVMLALAVAGGVGAYAIGNEPGAAARPRAVPAQPAALTVSFARSGLAEAGFTRIAPAQAEQALQQAAAFRPVSAPLAASFVDAFSPMTAALVVPEPQPAPATAPAPTRAAVPVRQPAPALIPPPAPIAAPDPVAQIEVAMLAVPVEAALATSIVPAEAPASSGDEDPGLVAASAAEPAAEQVAAEAALVGSSAAVAVLDHVAEPVLAQAPQTDPVPVSPEAAGQLLAPAPAVASAVPLAAIRTAAPAPSARPAPLTRPPTLAKAAPVASIASTRGKAAALSGPQIPSRYKLIDGGVESLIGIQLYGERIGALPLRVMGSGVPSLRLGDLLGLLRGRMDPARYETLAGSAAAEEFVSLDALRKSGIPVRYDAARDELKLGQE